MSSNCFHTDWCVWCFKYAWTPWWSHIKNSFHMTSQVVLSQGRTVTLNSYFIHESMQCFKTDGKVITIFNATIILLIQWCWKWYAIALWLGHPKETNLERLIFILSLFWIYSFPVGLIFITFIELKWWLHITTICSTNYIAGWGMSFQWVKIRLNF